MTMKTTINPAIPVAAIILGVFVFTACDSAGSNIQYGEISGPGSVQENSYSDYSINATGVEDITYQWSVVPDTSGTFTNSTSSFTTFNAGEVTSDVIATIRVAVTSDYKGPYVVTREIAITDTNRIPNAAASADKTKIGHGQSVQFFDESTDPEGDADIVKCEWDFTFDEDGEFCCECEERNPVHTFEQPGIFNVQLRITDSSGVTDMLQQPLVIEVAENYAPAITEVSHNRTTSQMGNNNEAVGLMVVFADASPDDDVHTFLWECDHGTFSDESILNPLWYPPDYAVECEISITVTDWYGLSDAGSCSQWVTSLPSRVNNSAPGNLIIPNNFETVFSGTINPGNWVFPNYPADGNVVFISFWATWSSPCVQGMPMVLSLNDMYEANPDYRHVMVNESEAVEDVFGFIYNNSYDAMYWALDEDASYFNSTKGWNDNSNVMPQHFLFDRDGRCRWAAIGQLTSTAEIQGYINGLL